MMLLKIQLFFRKLSGKFRQRYTLTIYQIPPSINRSLLAVTIVADVCLLRLEQLLPGSILGVECGAYYCTLLASKCYNTALKLFFDPFTTRTSS